MDQSSQPGRVGLKVIGILKLISGALALAVGIGVLKFLGHDPGPRAERIITHLGLDPQNQLIHTMISRLTGIDRTHLRALEAGTFFYAVLHAIEGTGLILGQHWAEYLVIVATSSLVPFEIYEIARKPNLVRFSLLILNVGIVIYLIATLKKQHRIRQDRPT
jgi:uncharacterized membrane protein (DUF2068 family)